MIEQANAFDLPATPERFELREGKLLLQSKNHRFKKSLLSEKAQKLR
jgi:hypothetical protein